MANSYRDVHAARHAAGKTYLEKCAAEDAARIDKERSTSGDQVKGVQTEGAVAHKKMGSMPVRQAGKPTKSPKPAKNPKQKSTSKRLKSDTEGRKI
jgi:hypothetical protein